MVVERELTKTLCAESSSVANEENATDDGDAGIVHQEDECLSSEQSISSNIEAFSLLTGNNGAEFFEKDRMIKWTTILPLERLSCQAAENILHTKLGVSSYVI